MTPLSLGSASVAALQPRCHERSCVTEAVVSIADSGEIWRL
jgi:hypothetical protein